MRINNKAEIVQLVLQEDCIFLTKYIIDIFWGRLISIFAEENSRFVEELVIKIAFIRWWDNCTLSTFRDWRMSGSRCDCDKVFIRDRVASRCTCSRAYRIREIIMRAFISFDKRFMTSAIPRSICKRHVSGTRKIGVVIPGKAGCVVVYSWGRRRINERRALLMYRISVDESRRDSETMGSCLRDANAANCLYAIRESNDANPCRMSRAQRGYRRKFPSRRIIPGSAIFWMNAETAAYKNIVTPRR